MQFPDGPKLDAKTLRRDGFGQEPTFRCFVAECTDDKNIVGYAIYFYCYSTCEGVCIYMEDLYVIPAFRHRGIGTQLWRAVAKVAVDRKCHGLNWTCLGWNKSSIELYKSKGSRNLTNDEELNLFKLVEPALTDFANGE